MKVGGSGFAAFCLALLLMASPVDAQTAALVEAGLKGRDFRIHETRTLSMLAGFKPQADVRLSRFGGWMDRSEKATGFFHTARVAGRWWLIDPEGHLFVSVGINSVAPPRSPKSAKLSTLHDTDRASNQAAADAKTRSHTGGKWIEDAAGVLHENRFNTLGCWSAGDEFRKSPTPIPYCLHWNFMRAYRADRKARYPGTGTAEAIYPFDPEFATFCDEHARALAVTKDDAWLIGHFIDNEMPLHENGIVGRYLQFPDSDPCHQAAAAFMRKRAAKPDKNDDRAFLQSVVKTYYRTVEEACRKHDPNHMLLGSRFHGQALASPALFVGAGPHTDIISVNYYGRWGVEQQRFDE